MSESVGVAPWQDEVLVHVLEVSALGQKGAWALPIVPPTPNLLNEKNFIDDILVQRLSDFVATKEYPSILHYLVKSFKRASDTLRSKPSSLAFRMHQDKIPDSELEQGIRLMQEVLA